MPIFVYYFDSTDILEGSKFINVIAFRMVNILPMSIVR